MPLFSESSASFCGRCNHDGEFRLAARFWTGGLVLVCGEERLAVGIDDGRLLPVLPADASVLTLSAPWEVWQALLAPVPPRFMNDVHPLIDAGLMDLDGDPLLFAQYYPAIARAIELLRPRDSGNDMVPAEYEPGDGQFYAPLGRYVRLNVQGQSYRVYFEEAGQGIPLLLQHTAGCHGSQWRHLFECREITEHFRLIAYDLPFHGKSLPPLGSRWWAEEYRLRAALVRGVPLALSCALRLQRPVFMGCSVGGVLALELARYHPDDFRAVISLEGTLKPDYDIAKLSTLWHPQVSNEYKARAMNALMSPTSPEAYRKETSQVYAAGWPPLFLGDLQYYMGEYDMRSEARHIDTDKVAVHILSGEYDFSGPIEAGKAAHAAIPGSSFQAMSDVGHFPMSENPQKFLKYLLPVLERIRAAG